MTQPQDFSGVGATGVGPMSPKTQKNIRQARARSFWIGPRHVEYKFWTGFFKVVPRWEVRTLEFFNEGPVRWFRCYWLTFGLSIYKLLPERRMRPSFPIKYSERRKQHQ